MSGFNWNDLRYFLDVARTGKLIASAKRLRADHTTVSRRIAALEEALNVTLFDRRPDGFSLTPEGERLRTVAEEMERAAIAAQGLVGDADRSMSGTVRIGAPDGFGSQFLAAHIGRLCDRFPDLEVQLVATPRVFSLSRREADIAISLSRPTEGRLVVRKLTDYHLRLYASADYLTARAPIETRADLAGHRFIGYIDDLIYTPELDYLAAVGSIAPHLKSSNLIAQLTATLAGAGLCILPRFIADRAVHLVPVLGHDVRITRSFWLIIHEDLRALARVAATADFIAETVLRRQAEFLPD